MAPEPPKSTDDDSLVSTVTEISERAALLVREEIELAKAEIQQRVSKLLKGAVVGIAAGIFFLMGLVFILWGGAWGLWSLIFEHGSDYVWAGFYILAALMFVLGVIAGLLAWRAVRSGTPPKPEMAIEEARKIRQTVSGPRGEGPANGEEPH